MPVAVQCPSCKRSYVVPEQQLGSRVRCNACSQDFTLAVVADMTAQEGPSDSQPRSATAVEALAPRPGSGKRLGRFEILDELGAGAFGKVYRAYDPVLEREVALKVPQASMVGNEEAAARFLREAKAAAQLTHPNIVPIFDAGSDGQQVFIASKYIEGHTLDATIEEDRIDHQQAAEILRQLADALAYAHDQGVIHRDIKPSNIMLNEHGQPHVMDFGLARLVDAREKLTHEGSLLGTPAYMSPEQAGEPGLEVGPASDQYSLGVVLYELLCHQKPFSGPLASLIYQIRKEDPPAPRTIRAEIPRDLEIICLKAIAKEPARRYADCNELSEDLQRWRDDRPILARRINPAERLWRWCRRNPAVAGLTGSVFLVVLLALVLVSWQWRSAVRAQTERTLAQADAILQADIRQVPLIIESLQPFWPEVVNRLKQSAARNDLTESERLRLSLALVSTDKGYVELLQKDLLTCLPIEFNVIRDALHPYRDELKGDLWEIASQSDSPADQRLRAACALATFDPNNSKRADVYTSLAELLVAENPLVLQTWLDALRPVRSFLVEPLSAIFRDQQRAESDRTLATRILLDFAADKPDVLVGLLTDSDQKQFATVFPGLQANRSAAIALLEAEIDKGVVDTATEEEKEVFARQQANAAIALLQLGQPDKVWSVLKHKPDPRARTYFIHWLSPLGGAPQILINRLGEESDDSIRRALLQTLGEFSEDQLSAPQREPLINKLLVIYENEPDPGLHGSAEWLLRRWGAAEQLVNIDMTLQTNEEQLKQQDEQRQWYLTTQGHTFVALDPGTFLMGTSDSEADRRSGEVLHHRRIGRRFAISAKEVTKSQFSRFQRANADIERFDIVDEWSQTDDSPQIGVDWYDAAAYCNWLSETQGIPEEQWCYLPVRQGTKIDYSEGMQPAPDYLIRTGYRLPPEAEWEFACRSGTVTGRYFGQTEALMDKYAWSAANAKGRTWPVAILKANDSGLFDMLGNATEWCHERYQDYPLGLVDSIEATPDSDAIQNDQVRVLRGGSFEDLARNVRSASRFWYHPNMRNFNGGFRVARTYR